MYLGELADALGLRLKDTDVSKDPGRSTAKLYINQAYRWIYRSHFWEFRRRVGEFVQVPNYTTGSATVTKYDTTNESAARTVTFTQTLPAGMPGRYVQFGTDSDWHRIIYTTGSTAYLETPVTIASGSYSFKIWKRFYYIPSDVEVITKLGKWSLDGKIHSRDASELQNIVIDMGAEGTPTDFSAYGDDGFFTPYTTGTISISKGTYVVTGSGTSFVGNVFPGDIFTVNSIDYRVKRVETDTRLILHNSPAADVTIGTIFSAKKDISLGLQLFPNENAYRTIPYVYFDKAFNMVNETVDRPNLPEAFDDVILTRSEFKYLKDKDNSKWIYVSQLYDNEMESLKRRYKVIQSPYQIFPIKIHSSMPGRFE